MLSDDYEEDFSIKYSSLSKKRTVLGQKLVMHMSLTFKDLERINAINLLYHERSKDFLA